MFYSRKMKNFASLLIIVVVLISAVSLDARRSSSFGGRRSSFVPRWPHIRPMHRRHDPPVYRRPSPPRHSVSHPPIVAVTPHVSVPTHKVSPSEQLIISEGGGKLGRVNNHESQSSPNRPSAPVDDSVPKVTATNQNQANPLGTNSGSHYPSWANPSAKPQPPSASKHHSSKLDGVPHPSAPFDPSSGKPPGPTSHEPIKPIKPSYEPIKPSHEPIKPSEQPIKPSHEPIKLSHEPIKPSYEPIKPSHEPIKPSYEPIKPSHEPIKPSQQPIKPSHEPIKPSHGPIKPSHEPIKPSHEPIKPSHEPIKPSHEPIKPSHEPIKPSYEPIKPSHEPIKPSYEPIKPSHEPIKPSHEPIKPSHEPIKPSHEPIKPSHEPIKPSHEPIKPSHDSHQNSAAPNIMPYQPLPSNLGGHPQGMPMPNTPHIGFENGAHTGGSHGPIGSPHNHPFGNSPTQHHGGEHSQPTVINNYYHSPASSIGSPQNPAGPGQPVIPQSSDPGLGQLFKAALVTSSVDVGVRMLANKISNDYSNHHQMLYTPEAGEDLSTTANRNAGNNNQDGSPIPEHGDAPVQGIPQPVQLNTSSVNTNLPAGGERVDQAVQTESLQPNAKQTGSPRTNPEQTGSLQPNATISNGTGDQTTPAADPAKEPQYFISNDELGNFTEKLFEKELTNASNYITLNLQNQSSDPIATDRADTPLIYVGHEAYMIPTIQAFRNLFDNYEFNSEKKESPDSEKREEENVMLDAFLNTDIMTTAMQWLADKGYIESDKFEWKDALRRIWMSKINEVTSGFERVFLAEKYPGSGILGGQNWLYFDHQEALQLINYLSYVDKINLGDKGSLLKVNFKIDDVMQSNTTILVGTPPELEMALYTICYYTRPNDLCSVSLGGTRFTVYTHAFNYLGKYPIDLGYVFF